MSRIRSSVVVAAAVRSCLLLPAGFALQVGSLSAQAHLWQLDSGGEEMHVIDYGSGKTVDRIPVGPEPHEIATTPDGRWIYVPCRDGHYWVVNGRERRVIKRIHTGGRPHNTRASRNGRFMYLSPMGEPERVVVVDVEAGHRVVGHIDFRNSVRPPAIAEARGLFFQQVDGLNGFQVADLDSRRVLATVEHAGDLGWFLLPWKKLGWIGPEGLKRCHGLEVRPGEEEIWSVCGNRVSIHELTSGRYPTTGTVSLPEKGYWLTFSPSGAFAFVALSDEGRVIMVNARSRRITKSFTAGGRPKRNLVVPPIAGSPSSSGSAGWRED